MTPMSPSEMEAFLSDVHVGVVSISVADRGPLTVPIWYSYEPGGDVGVMTFETSWKARLLEKGVRISLCVQNEQPPYRYVRVEGPVVAIEVASFEREIKPLVHRYLDPAAGDRYIKEAYPDPEQPRELFVRMRPEWWSS